VDGSWVFNALLGSIAGIAIDPHVVYVARFPGDRAGSRLLAQSLSTNAAMGISCRFVFLHMDTPYT
jgi:hypothetical protein